MQYQIDPSSTCSWHKLVQEALTKSNRHLTQDLESYLIFLLMRFTNNTRLADSILALEYLDSQNLSGNHQHEHLRNVGDKCLLFAGFYPEQAPKKLVSIPYFVNLGRGAYDQIAKQSIYNHQLYNGLNDLFAQLSLNFVNLLSVLHQVKLLDQTCSWQLDAITQFETKRLTDPLTLKNTFH